MHYISNARISNRTSMSTSMVLLSSVEYDTQTCTITWRNLFFDHYHHASLSNLPATWTIFLAVTQIKYTQRVLLIVRAILIVYIQYTSFSLNIDFFVHYECKINCNKSCTTHALETFTNEKWQQINVFSKSKFLFPQLSILSIT